jgi:hypothetical protein
MIILRPPGTSATPFDGVSFYLAAWQEVDSMMYASEGNVVTKLLSGEFKAGPVSLEYPPPRMAAMKASLVLPPDVCISTASFCDSDLSMICVSPIPACDPGHFRHTPLLTKAFWGDHFYKIQAKRLATLQEERSTFKYFSIALRYIRQLIQHPEFKQYLTNALNVELKALGVSEQDKRTITEEVLGMADIDLYGAIIRSIITIVGFRHIEHVSGAALHIVKFVSNISCRLMYNICAEERTRAGDIIHQEIERLTRIISANYDAWDGKIESIASLESIRLTVT